MSYFFKDYWLETKQLNLLKIAYQMLIFSRKKFIGMLIGSTFSAFIIMNQPGIYQGISDRLVSDIQAITEPDLWVMASTSRDFNAPTFFTGLDIYRIRSIPSVLWAKQLYRIWYPMKHLNTDNVKSWMLIGVDPDSLIGLPKTLLLGAKNNIHNSNALIIDGYALKQLETIDKKTIAMGDKLVEGRNNWVVTGISKPLRTYMIQPKAYTLSNHLPDLIHRPSFILVKVKKNADLREVALRIHQKTGYDALTQDEFVSRSLAFFREHTPIILIFICIAIMGFIIGLIIMWQIFNNFILTHLHQFGMLKMLGVSNRALRNMVLFQAFITGGIGYLMGLILALLFGLIVHDTQIAFHLTWKIALLGALGTAVIIVLSSCFSIIKVFRMDTVDLCRDLN